MRYATTALLALPLTLALPSIHKRQDEPSRIADSWIVSLEDNENLDTVLREISSTSGIESTNNYTIGSFRGFAFSGSDAVVDQLALMSSLKTIESDLVVEAYAPIPSELDARALVTQSGSTYGLSRISSRARGGNSYRYDDSAGAGVNIYVLDTGIQTTHQDFAGRAIAGASFVDSEPNTVDGHGHGTHCAGTAMGTRFGVAKRSTAIAVKVLGADGRGTLAGILGGVNWAVNDARSRGGVGRSILSMSLGSPFSQVSNDAVAQAVAAGVFVAAASGNNNQPAANYSPGSEPSICTVGGTDINDRRYAFSNYGPVVDVHAPGVDVQSAWIGSNTATRSLTGTSMACPHVAGIAAYLITLEGPRSPAALCQRIKDLATRNVISDVQGSANLLAYNGNGR